MVISFADVPQRSIAYGLEGYPELGTICHALTVTALTTKSFKVNSGNYEYIAFYYCNDLVNIPSDCQIEKGITATAYTPYNGDTVTIAFGQKAYGGQLDVTRGKLMVTHKLEHITADYDWSASTVGTNYHQFMVRINDMVNCLSVMSDKFEMITTGERETKTGIVSFNDSNFRLSLLNSTGVSTLTDFKTYLTTIGGTDICYELATPFDIDLTPEVISAIVGTNNVFADCGQSTVKYLKAGA